MPDLRFLAAALAQLVVVGLTGMAASANPPSSDSNPVSWKSEPTVSDSGTRSLAKSEPRLACTSALFHRAEPLQPLTPPAQSALSPIALADVNGDGIPDLVGFGNAGMGGAVRLGLGDGRFKPAIYSRNLDARALADFDGDGKTDAIGLQQLYLGNGDGTFRQKTLWTNSPALAVTAADFDGDGKPDIAAQFPTNLLFFPGQGNGSFGPPVALPGAPTDYAAMAKGDFNGDGLADFLDIIRDGATVYLSEGRLPLHKAVRWTGEAPQFYYNYTAGDVNGDGKDDLVSFVSGYPASFLQVDLSNGDGTFAATPNHMLSESNTSASGIALADFNGDGKLDIALLTVPFPGNVILNVLLGNGDGTFQEPAKFVTFLHVEPSLSLATADLNGDGTPDLVVGDLSEGFDVWLNDCTPDTPPSIYAPPLSQIVEEGRDATFSVGASGVLALSYQWLFNGTNIAGATGPSLTIHQARPSDSGTYSVVVRSGTVSATSAGVTLTVTPSASLSGWTNLDQTALQQALNSGSSIQFGVDGIVQLSSALIVSTNATLDAANHTVVLDGSNLTRHFLINSGATLRLVNLVLRNGHAHGPDGIDGVVGGPGFGGSIASVGGNLELTRCTFTNNQASGGGGSPAFSGTGGAGAFGGAVYSINGSVSATHCTFAGNGSRGGKGGDATEGPFFSVPGGDSYGGGLFTSNSLVHLVGVQFLNNLAQAGEASGGKPRHSGAASFGGAYAALSGAIDLHACEFTSNTATGEANYAQAPADRGSANGGALFHSGGALSATQVLFASNSVTGGGGVNSTLEGNAGANGNGGAVCNDAGQLELRESAFVFNRAAAGTPTDFFNQTGLSGTASGGAFYNRGFALLVNCTLAGNVADGGLTNASRLPGTGGAARGGALYSEGGTVSLLNVTISQNTVKPGNQLSLAFGASIGTSNSVTTLTNTILACSPSQTNVFGVINDGGHNLCSDASAALSTASSHNSADPMLGPLADNGGPTPTLALLLGSPDFDSGDPAACPLIDQRGIPRPLGAGCDIGAFELAPKVSLSISEGLATLVYLLEPNRTYGIQASTNLLDWTSVGSADADQNGRFEFKSSSSLPWRFFRVTP